MKPRRVFWWLDTVYWFIISGMVVNIAGCAFCLLYPDSVLNQDSSGNPSPPVTTIVGIVTGAAAICFSVWGLRLNTRRRKVMDDYRRSLQ